MEAEFQEVPNAVTNSLIGHCSECLTYWQLYSEFCEVIATCPRGCKDIQYEIGYFSLAEPTNIRNCGLEVADGVLSKMLHILE
jgi:hypothetical protein